MKPQQLTPTSRRCSRMIDAELGGTGSKVDRMAALLDQVGIGPGDVVGALIEAPEVVIGFLALARLGPFMRPSTSSCIRSYSVPVHTANIRAVFTEDAFDGLLKGVLFGCPTPVASSMWMDRVVMVRHTPGRLQTCRPSRTRRGSPRYALLLQLHLRNDGSAQGGHHHAPEHLGERSRYHRVDGLHGGRCLPRHVLGICTPA